MSYKDLASIYQAFSLNPNDRNLRILISACVKFQDEMINDAALAEARDRNEMPFDDEGCGFSLDARISTIENHLQSLKEIKDDALIEYRVTRLNTSIGTSDCAVSENTDW